MLLESAKILVENMPEKFKRKRISGEKDMADYEVEETGGE